MANGADTRTLLALPSFDPFGAVSEGPTTANSTEAASLSGKAAPPPAELSALNCSDVSMTGSVKDRCTVTLSKAASISGLSVSLSSSNAAVTVPAKVTVSANATSASFTASVSPVGETQAVTLTARAGRVSKSFSLELNAEVRKLSTNATSVAFGDVAVHRAATQSVTLKSLGSAPVTIDTAALKGRGFTISVGKFPVTLNPGEAATLHVEFDPSAAGVATGQLTIASNATTSGKLVISLSGTGEDATLEVGLSWDAPSVSADPVAGYNVYRSNRRSPREGGNTPYQLLNSSVNATTTYVDSTVQSGLAYDYYVTSVDAFGVESAPSNTAGVTIP